MTHQLAGFDRGDSSMPLTPLESASFRGPVFGRR
jgi:hypothetical protein